jgi:uncharacterized protein YjbI with pentapeptide repeats
MDVVINDTNFIGSDLSDSRVYGKIMELSHFGDTILVNTNFSGSTFKGRLWSEPSFLSANAANSDFSKCSISMADFSHTNFEGADFTDSSLELVEISTGNLKNTNFTKCFITDFNICDANLENTNFSDAVFTGFLQASDVKFNNVNFTRAKGRFEEVDLENTIYEKTGLPIGIYHLDRGPSMK